MLFTGTPPFTKREKKSEATAGEESILEQTLINDFLFFFLYRLIKNRKYINYYSNKKLITLLTLN